jgi:hypothetical protein
MLTIFVNLFFGIPINSTTFSRFFYVLAIQQQLLLCLFTSLCSICRGIVYFSFRNNRLFINDDLSLGKAELGM